MFCLVYLAYENTNESVEYDVLKIAHLTITDELDHNKLFGFYKIAVHDKSKGSTMFWGDSSGSQRFYYCERMGIIADKFTTCVKKINTEIKPCYEAIYQYLSIERTLDDKTIADGIKKTSRECVYLLTDNTIKIISKKLKPFSECDPDFTLEKLMRVLTANINNKSIAAVVTGGTDSRSILAHLINLKYSPKLFLTGRAESKDVQIAKKIAIILVLPIDIYNPTDKEPNWILRAFEFSNGIYDVVLSYRHLRKAELSDDTIAYEFGGVGGEYYKNSYCRPFRFAQPFKKLTSTDIVNNVIGSAIVCKPWYGGTSSNRTIRYTKTSVLDAVDNKHVIIEKTKEGALP